ncbi:Hypothetical protein CAP_7048 [Chondromyces apiculatus DSM 436]|uniref:Protein kinase domain-containing protein n=1 Tax=Chondromyces apiculatus DSM 436 TaxID=1192034 RepID=A0A017THF8_9BACT|nr:Hypothetical protein CAP_7048 [Chondromyces apiculatus DSM 436]
MAPASCRRSGCETLPVGAGHYEVVSRLATGGMAELFLARRVAPGGIVQPVVIKRLLPEMQADPEAVQGFLAEAWIASRLRHPNVVRFLDVVNHEGRDHLVLEHVEGCTLSALMRFRASQGQPLPLRLVLTIAISLLRGLGQAHALVGEEGQPLGLVHRDVSPRNVLLSIEGEVKLTDFGVAKATGLCEEHEVAPGSGPSSSPWSSSPWSSSPWSSSPASSSPASSSPWSSSPASSSSGVGSSPSTGTSQKTDEEGEGVASGARRAGSSGLVKGTPGYLAPEQLLGKPVDARTDLFAVGVLLFELVTCKRLFRGRDCDELMRAALLMQVPSLSTLRPGCPVLLEGVVRRALAPEPHQRFANAAEMEQALAEVLVSLDMEEGRDRDAGRTLAGMVREAMREAPRVSRVSGGARVSGRPRASVPPAATAPDRDQPTVRACVLHADAVRRASSWWWAPGMLVTALAVTAGAFSRRRWRR